MFTAGVQLLICSGGGGHARRVHHPYPAEGYAEYQIMDTLSMVSKIKVETGAAQNNSQNKHRNNPADKFVSVPVQ